jgi:hypothetical protein
MSDKLETVATFTDLTQAQAARSALEAAEIAVFLRDENTGSIDWGLMPALGGLRLEVESEDAGRAREVLAELDLEPAGMGLSREEELEEVAHREAARRRKRLVGVVTFLILLLPTLLALIFGWME